MIDYIREREILWNQAKKKIKQETRDMWKKISNLFIPFITKDICVKVAKCNGRYNSAGWNKIFAHFFISWCVICGGFAVIRNIITNCESKAFKNRNFSRISHEPRFANNVMCYLYKLFLEIYKFNDISSGIDITFFVPSMNSSITENVVLQKFLFLLAYLHR